MSSQQLMSAFESAEDENWTDDRSVRPTHQGWGLLNFLSRRNTNSQASSSAATTTPGAGSSGGTDAVFGNLLAKQEAPSEPLPLDDETTPNDTPPSYQEAANDNAPSYWETTIMATGWCDDVLVDDLPVGTNLQLIWNLLLSFAFGIGGFIGTYLLHTTHACKAGSVLGLALTLLQNSYDSNHNDGHTPRHRDPNEFRPDNPNSYDDVPLQTGTMQPGLQQPDAPDANVDSSSAWHWLNLIFALILVYWALSGYIRAYRIKLAVLQQSEGQEPVVVQAPDGTEETHQHPDHGMNDNEEGELYSAPSHVPTNSPPREPAPDYNAPSHP